MNKITFIISIFLVGVIVYAKGIDVFTRNLRFPERAPMNAMTAKIAFEPYR